ncbi:MAG TPA: FtsX-like permease family protein, partial [Chitinophagaceae bacterium]|nr:FtsX-like permease family protein [Chitinophagaceae bacterium]
AINKRIRISSSTNGDFDFTVTGVFIPSQTPSHIDAKFFMSFLGGGMYQSSSQSSSLATNNMYHTYFLLQPGSDPKKLEAKFPDFIRKYAGEDLKAMGFYKKQFLTKISDIHLHSKVKKNVTPAGSLTYLYILISIAAFTLLIACINFMNLSTARSSKRSAEVGVRKVLGAEKKSLIRQFLGESLLMSIIAFLFALLFTQILLPVFSAVAGKTFSFSFQQYAVILAGFFVLAILTGFLAGSYPAFYLSSFKPVKVLKGKIANTLAVVSFRRALVVFQFVISVVLIVASVVISNQMKYLRSTDLGFAEDQQIVIPLRSGTAKNIYTSLKTELARQKDIKSVGASLYYPGIMNPSDIPFYKEGSSVNNSKRFFMNWVDDGFLSTLEIKPLAGRIFSNQFLADTSSRMVINQQGAKELGFKTPQEAVGKFALFDWQGETYRYEIVGVVKDFHFKDLHVPIEPCGMQLINRPQFNYIVAHASTPDISRTLKNIEASWKNLNPNEPFEYSFMDQDFQKNYVSDERLASIVTYFTVIAILISCLGLFGLAAFSAEQRIKEIGVRKVLGANVGNIIALLSKDFMKLVFVAIVIASPIAWFAMNRWLQDFAYRTPINWQVFAVTAAIALFIALATVSFQAIKAAVANPVKSLRTE